MPTMMRNAKKRDRDRRPIVARPILQPLTSPFESCVRIRLPSTGISIAIAVRLAGSRREWRTAISGTPARRLPMRLDRRELGRLVLERVEAVQVADQDLQRHQDASAATASSTA